MNPDGDRETAERGLSRAARRLLAIAAYYACAAIGVALLWRFVPGMHDALAGSRLDEAVSGTENAITRSLGTAAEGAAVTSAWEQGTRTLFVMFGALATTIPVAAVYSLTRRRKGFDQSMVHTLVLLPLAVSGMVVLIQNSLALAFSLAGIVAVLRFRNSLEDVKDGVYVFVCVSIGMSAAVGALAIGFVTSAVFNACVLVLWWIDFARRPTPGIRGGLWRLARLPKVPPPRAPNGARKPAGADDRVGDEVFAAAARAWRRQLQLTAEHRIGAPAERFNASLRVQSVTPDASRPLIEALLRARTSGWELKGIVPGGAGTFTLKYHVRVRRSERAGLLDAVRATAETVGVELR